MCTVARQVGLDVLMSFSQRSRQRSWTRTSCRALLSPIGRRLTDRLCAVCGIVFCYESFNLLEHVILCVILLAKVCI